MNNIPENVKFVLNDINSNILWNYIDNLLADIAQSQEIIIELQEANERLKELCNKYEEEHNTTFQEWQQDILMNKATIKDVEFYKSRIDKAIEYIKGMPDEMEYHGLLYDNKEKKLLLNILQGSEDNE